MSLYCSLYTAASHLPCKRCPFHPFQLITGPSRIFLSNEQGYKQLREEDELSDDDGGGVDA
jgi:hypothetical protein